jgi:hypothetical protein
MQIIKIILCGRGMTEKEYSSQSGTIVFVREAANYPKHRPHKPGAAKRIIFDISVRLSANSLYGQCLQNQFA